MPVTFAAVMVGVHTVGFERSRNRNRQPKLNGQYIRLSCIAEIHGTCFALDNTQWLDDRRLHEMDNVFSKLVETVPEVTKREEECHSLEDETARIVSHQGGSSLMQVSRENVSGRCSCCSCCCCCSGAPLTLNPSRGALMDNRNA